MQRSHPEPIIYVLHFAPFSMLLLYDLVEASDQLLACDDNNDGRGDVG
jgi:hypothetical protein